VPSLSSLALITEPMQVVLDIYPPEVRDGELDMCELIDDEPFWARIAQLFAPDAEVRFITPDAGGMGGMAGPFRGPAGFRAGWREWLQPFDRFRIETEEPPRTAVDGRVVLLAKTFGTLQGSSVEVEQPSAVVYRVQAGRVVEANHYLEHEQALRDAGLA
jgi:ketosteroid isomerase-like protein